VAWEGRRDPQLLTGSIEKGGGPVGPPPPGSEPSHLHGCYGTVAQITYAVTDQLPRGSAAVANPVTLQPVGGEPPVGSLAWMAGLAVPPETMEPPPPRAFLPLGQLTAWVLGLMILLALVAVTSSSAHAGGAGRTLCTRGAISTS
jgi:hypothetical protein